MNDKRCVNLIPSNNLVTLTDWDQAMRAQPRTAGITSMSWVFLRPTKSTNQPVSGPDTIAPKAMTELIHEKSFVDIVKP